MPLKEYFMQCGDALTSVDKPVSHDDHILYILSSLGSEFESMIFVITAWFDSPSVQDITTLLLNQESRIESKIVSTEASLPSVNLISNTIDRENNLPRQNN